MAKKKDGMSKVEMVREAIAKLGWDVGAAAYQEYIKATHNVEMSKPHISQTKSAEKRRQGIRKRRKVGRPRKDASVAPVSAAPVSVVDLLAFVETVKQWEQKIGASSIREVVKSVLKK